MSPPEPPRNPEHRSTNALLCFCIGAALAFLSWFLGVGTVMATAFSGGNPAVVVGGVVAAIGLVVMTLVSVLLMGVGAVWMFIQVVADQRGEASEKRYRDVER
jgi:hypothetical protein